MNLMKQIEAKLFTKQVITNQTSTTFAPSIAQLEQTIPISEPFAVVDQIEPNSPAQQAHVLLGDEIIQFGNITKQTENPLQGVANIVRNSEGKQIKIIVKRVEPDHTTTTTTTMKSLSLCPRRWAPNKGLLG